MAPLCNAENDACSAPQTFGLVVSSTRLAFLRLHGADAMLCCLASCVQARFTPDQRPQYVYSPRELSRWVRGVFEAVSPLDSLSPQALVRVWAHEALRLFHDRLTDDAEREWCNTTLDQVCRTPTPPSSGHTGTDGFGVWLQVAATHFPAAGEDALARPILFSKWLSKHPRSVNRDELRTFVAARLRVSAHSDRQELPILIR